MGQMSGMTAEKQLSVGGEKLKQLRQVKEILNAEVLCERTAG